MPLDDKFSASTRGHRFLPFHRKEEKQWSREFTFIQAADTQFGMMDSYIDKKDVVGWDREMALSRELVKQINSMSPQPRFLVICGDLLDAFPDTQEKMRDCQEKDFKIIFNELQIPCVCVCGNHDIGNQPNQVSVRRYRASFGDDFFSFWCGGVYFLVINTQYYENPKNVPELAAEQEHWLNRQLEKIKRKKPKHVVVFQHIPFFLNHPDEEKEYFNFLPKLRHQILERLYDGGVRHVFTGHYHRNAGGMYKDMQQVVTSAVGAQLGDDGHGYRVVRVTEHSLEHEYRTLICHVDLPPVVAMNIVLETSERGTCGDRKDEQVLQPSIGRHSTPA